MAVSQQVYPLVGFYFKVIFTSNSGIYETGFESVSGLEVKIETEQINEGGENQFTRKLPKKLQYPNLVLRRGLFLSSQLMDWINKAVQNFIFEPRMVTVLLMDEKGESVMKWAFHNVFPVSLKVSDLNATENKYAVEILELSYDYFEKAG